MILTPLTEVPVYSDADRILSLLFAAADDDYESTFLDNLCLRVGLLWECESEDEFDLRACFAINGMYDEYCGACGAPKPEENL